MNVIQSGGFRRSNEFNREGQAIAKMWNGLFNPDDRWRVIHLLKRVGHLMGFTAPLVDHVEYVVSQTSRSSWEPGNHPYFWKKVQDQAQELHITERQVCNRENRLIELGAFSFNGYANGRRFPLYDDKGNVIGAFGLDLAPLMSLLPKLEALEENQQKELFVCRQIKTKVQAIRQECRAMIFEASERNVEGWEHYADQLEDYMGRIDTHMDLEHLFVMQQKLEVIQSGLQVLFEMQGLNEKDAALDAAFPEEDQRDEDCGQSVHTSGTAEIDFRHIEDTIEPRTFFKSKCNPSGDKKHERSSPEGSQEDTLVQADACGVQKDCLQVKTASDFDQRKQIINAYTDPATLCGAVHITPEMAAFAGSPRLRGKLPTTRVPVDEDIIFAAQELMHELGIARHVWDRGAYKLGAYATALAVILTDVLYREEEPKWKPGEYITGIIRKEPRHIRLNQSFFNRLKKKHYFVDENRGLSTHEGSFSRKDYSGRTH